MRSIGYFVGLLFGWLLACFALGFALYIMILFGSAGWHTAEWLLSLVLQ